MGIQQWINRPTILFLIGLSFLFQARPSLAHQGDLPFDRAAVETAVVTIVHQELLPSLVEEKKGSGFFFKHGEELFLIARTYNLFGADSVEVAFSNGSRYPLQKVATLPYLGLFLGVVDFQGQGFPGTLLEMRDSPLAAGDQVFFVGGAGIQRERVVSGHVVKRPEVYLRIGRNDLNSRAHLSYNSILTATTGDQTTERFAGGPILDESGYVVGIHLAKVLQDSENDWVKIFVPIRELFKWLRDKGRVARERDTTLENLAFKPFENWKNGQENFSAKAEQRVIEAGALGRPQEGVVWYENNVPSGRATKRLRVIYYMAKVDVALETSVDDQILRVPLEQAVQDLAEAVDALEQQPDSLHDALWVELGLKKLAYGQFLLGDGEKALFYLRKLDIRRAEPWLNSLVSSFAEIGFEHITIGADALHEYLEARSSTS